MFKDDWTRSQTTLHLLTSSALALDQATYAPPRYASPRFNNDYSSRGSFSPTERSPRPGATVASAPLPPPMPVAANGGAGDAQRLYLSALEPASVAPAADRVAYYVSGDGAPRWTVAPPVARTVATPTAAAGGVRR